MSRLGDVSLRTWSVLAGLVVGAAGVVALLAAGVLQTEPHRIEGVAAEEAFVDAWRLHRSGTFVVESEWRRTNVATDATMYSATLLAQAPPHRVLRQFGSVRGRLDGRRVRCSTGPGESYRCFPSDYQVPPFDQELEGEIEDLRTNFDLASRLYSVSSDDAGCFELVQVTSYPDPPYGRAATMCFDDETGALEYVRRDFGRIVEEVEATSIRTEVTPADFNLEDNAAYRPVGDLPDLLEQLLAERAEAAE